MADKCPHWDFRLFQFAINPDTYRKNNSQLIAPPGALPCAMAPRCTRRTEQLRQRRGKPETPVLQAQLETSHSSPLYKNIPCQGPVFTKQFLDLSLRIKKIL
ncbi:hypothetical protein DPMN_030624 [Dreissena polymorpha]|uniref:Uncharacterized protein n=1 Tax=Dreissena polymorpha TaxID=45954 RepID=A0A9D4RIG8_DREPO|nr:hypothetical protein DPMN_030624 [Dreissena polymorpha]